MPKRFCWTACFSRCPTRCGEPSCCGSARRYCWSRKSRHHSTSRCRRCHATSRCWSAPDWCDRSAPAAISRCSLEAGPIFSAALWLNRYSNYWQEQFDLLAASMLEIDELTTRKRHRKEHKR